MKGRKFSLLLVLITVVAVALALTACKTPIVSDNTTDNGPKSLSVSSAMTGVYNALKSTNGATAEAQFLSVILSGKYADDDLNNHTFGFESSFDISEANLNGGDHNSKFAFYLREESTDTLNIYLSDATLYVKYPPVVNDAKFQSVDLASVVKAINDSYHNGGTVKTSADLIPALGESIFSAAYYEVTGNAEKYTLVLSYSKLAGSLAELLSILDIGLSYGGALGLMGYTESEMAALASASDGSDAAVIVNIASGKIANTAVVDDVASALAGTYAGKESSVITSLTVTSSAKNISLPDNLASYKVFDFANLSMSGTLKIDAANASQRGEFFTQSVLATTLTPSSYTYDYTFKSNRRADGNVEFSLTLHTPSEKDIAVFCDGTKLYVNLSSFGIAPVKLDAAELLDDFGELGILTEGVSLTYKQIIKLIGDAFGSRTVNGYITKYSFDGADIAAILAQLGYDSVLDYDAFDVTINTRNKEFTALTLAFSAMGATFTFNGTSPVVGTAVTVTAPEWAATATDLNAAENFTPVLTGSIREATSAADDVSLLSSLVYSLTGTEVNFAAQARSHIRFKASANIASDGALKALKLDFYTTALNGTDGDYIAGLYYAATDANYIYVIYPADDLGNTRADRLPLKPVGDRYTAFLNAINGNVAEDYDTALWSFSNATGYSLSANCNAINALLGKIKSVFLSGLNLSVLPADFSVVETVLGYNEGAFSFRAVFGASKYVHLDIETMALNYNDITPVGISSTAKSVSLYADNSMDEVTTVTMGDGTVYKLYLTANGVKQWQYSSHPTVGNGSVEVIASINVFGKTLNVPLTVDTSAVTVTSIPALNFVDAQYVSGTAFSFPRYNCAVDPIKIITDCNEAMLSDNNLKSVVWYVAGKDIATGGINTVSESQFVLNPYVTDYFGFTVPLYASSPYTVSVIGDVAQSVALVEGVMVDALAQNGGKLSATYVTGGIKADPYSAATYGSKLNLVFASGTPVQTTAMRFDVKNIDVTDLDTADGYGSPDLDAAMFNCSGKFKVPVIVLDCMGCERTFYVEIEVVPNVISSIAFNSSELADGVTYSESVEDGIVGKFTVNPLVTDSLSSVNLPKFVTCGEGAGSFGTTTLKWDVSAIRNTSLTSGADGTLTLIIGNDVGGYQTFNFRYVFSRLAVKSVAICDKNGDVISAVAAAGAESALMEQNLGDKNSVSFTAINLNPYSYIAPAKIKYVYSVVGEVTESVFYSDVNWSFNPELQPENLWSTAKTYSSSIAISGLTINLSLSFVAKTYNITKDFSFPVIEGNVVARFPEGDVQYVQYEEEKKVNRLVFMAYGAIDSSMAVDYTDVNKYPTQVNIPFTDGTTALLNIGWDLSAYSENANIISDGFRGDVVAKLIIGEKDGKPIYGESIKVRVYVASGKADDTYTGMTVDETVLSGLITTGSLGNTGFTATATYAAIKAANTAGVLTLNADELEALDRTDRAAKVALVLEKAVKLCFFATQDPAEELIAILNEGLAAGILQGVSNSLTFSVISYDEVDGRVVKTDPRNLRNYPTYLYFNYSGSETLSNSMFKVKQWDFRDSNGNNKIDRYYIDRLFDDATLSLQNVATNGDLTVSAEVGNDKTGYIKVPVSIIIVATDIENVVLTSIPLASSSVVVGGNSRNTMDYSVKYVEAVNGEYVLVSGEYVVYNATFHRGLTRYDSEFTLTLNPYMADACSAASYPRQIQFTLNKGYSVTMDVLWDLSTIPTGGVYNGGEYQIDAYIDVGFSYAKIIVPVKLVILEKELDSVRIGGENTKHIYVDPYEAEPYGAVVDGDIVYLDVTVKFKGEENWYPLTLKYDKSDVELRYVGGTLKSNINVLVGNDAGGWQLVGGYNLIAYQRQLLKVEGVTYTCDTCGAVSYVYLDTCVAANCDGTAFTLNYYDIYSLTVVSENIVEEFETIDFSHDLPDTLRFTYGNPTDVSSNVISTVKRSGLNNVGAVFNWRRENEHLVLAVWNNTFDPEATDEQTLHFTDATGYASLSPSMFYRWDTIADFDYSGVSAAKYLYDLYITSDVEGINDYLDLYVALWTDADEDGALDSGELSRLADTDVLNAGKYYVVAALTEKDGMSHSLYGTAQLNKAFTVIPRNIDSSVTVRQNTKPLATAYTATFPAVISDELRAETTIPNVSVVLKYYKAEDVGHTTPIDFTDITKIRAGVYDYVVEVEDGNYTVTAAGAYTKGTFTISPMALTGITVTINDATENYSVVKGSTPTIIVACNENVVLTNTVDLVYYECIYFIDTNSNDTVDAEEITTLATVDLGEFTSREIKLAVRIVNPDYTADVKVVTVTVTAPEQA